jgi:hypothetical protein
VIVVCCKVIVMHLRVRGVDLPGRMHSLHAIVEWKHVIVLSCRVIVHAPRIHLNAWARMSMVTVLSWMITAQVTTLSLWVTTLSMQVTRLSR